jgi:chromosome segregation ATPase
MSKQMKSLAVLAIVVLGSACQKPPQAELDAMRQAALDAAADQPLLYAPDAWQNAEQAMLAVDEEIAAQAEKFSLTRSYKKTSELISAADAAVGTARDQAKQTMQQMTDETGEALTATRSALDSSRALLAELGACKRKPKGFATDLEALDAQLTALTAQADELEQLLADRELMDAEALAGSVLSGAEALAADLENAKSKLGC